MTRRTFYRRLRKLQKHMKVDRNDFSGSLRLRTQAQQFCPIEAVYVDTHAEYRNYPDAAMEMGLKRRDIMTIANAADFVLPYLDASERAARRAMARALGVDLSKEEERLRAGRRSYSRFAGENG